MAFSKTDFNRIIISAPLNKRQEIRRLRGFGLTTMFNTVCIVVASIVGLLFVRELIVSYFYRNALERDFSTILFDMENRINLIEELIDHNSKKLAADIPLASKIDDFIHSARVDMRASRSYILRFHNGSNFTTNSPVWKFSMTHESTESSIVSVSETTRDILVTNMLPLITPIFNTNAKEDEFDGGIKEIHHPDESEDEKCRIFCATAMEMESTPIRGFMLMRGISKMLYSPIYDFEKRPIGLFCLDYNGELPEYFNAENITEKFLGFTSILSMMVK